MPRYWNFATNSLAAKSGIALCRALSSDHSAAAVIKTSKVRAPWVVRLRQTYAPAQREARPARN
ncbi:conserved domain protein [delta proteobacterium NaphS2]|nr:conserved domain protein [delta proteobacterium NaphS2]